MSKSKQRSGTLSGLIDSDSEDGHFIERDVMPIAVEDIAPVKKARGRPKAAPGKVVETKAPPRRTSGRLNGKNAAAPGARKGGRKALTDKTNNQNASNPEELDEFIQDDDINMGDAEVEDTVMAVKLPKPRTTKTKVAAGRTKAVKNVSRAEENIEASIVEAPKPEPRQVKKRGQAKQEIPEEPSLEKVILESQVSLTDVKEDVDEEVEVEESVSRTASNAARSRADSRVPQPSLKRRRAGSASDTERSDPALRRKLGEMSKKYENLHIKYQDLREIGIKEAERNFELANENIAALKADIAAQTALAKESKTLKKKLEAQSTDLAALQLQVSQLHASLSEARSDIKSQATENKALLAEKKTLSAENKTLSTKLAANRSAAASVESAIAKVPGSAMKANGGIRLMGTAEAALTAQAAQLKEDLYSDLTGLIIRSVKRETEEDLFDCIQTGRNGTLHFKLSAANEKSADSYDDAQCNYVPQLDPSRDKALIELLPDYLVDEITFPRPQAAKFYARVVKALTERAS
ncbi:hypothetical protein G7Y89_g5640 [Cudoniella acicularis]|uniref:Monopolin complex subunit Csm1/Pcs1 C-terminal domain-containing protein n=1 Tax=Cudoniella acicularis TaxID=354080 RepID=A0A8H4W6A9_9HELO|nr:hypothetical protein G7Y89_g5640 [Cudoniella acicularis]